MKYKVLKGFYDGQDGRTHYRVGETYPREGLKPTKARVNELGKGGYIEVPKPKAKPKTKKDSE